MSSDNVSEAQRQVEAKQKFIDEKEKDLSERQRQFELRMQEQQARFTTDKTKFDVSKKELEQKEKDFVSAFLIIIKYTSIEYVLINFGGNSLLYLILQEVKEQGLNAKMQAIEANEEVTALKLKYEQEMAGLQADRERLEAKVLELQNHIVYIKGQNKPAGKGIESIEMTQWVSVEPFDPSSPEANPQATCLKMMNWRIDKDIDINDIKSNIEKADPDIFGLSINEKVCETDSLQNTFTELGYSMKVSSQSQDTKVAIVYKRDLISYALFE